jgi:hypothetical protein
MATFVMFIPLLNVHVTLTPTSAVGEGATVVLTGVVVVLNVVVVKVVSVVEVDVEGATVIFVVVEMIFVVEVASEVVFVVVSFPRSFPSVKDENMSKNAMKIFI